MQSILNVARGLRRGILSGTTINNDLLTATLLPYIAIGGVRFKHSSKIRYRHGTKFNPEAQQHHGFLYFPRDPEHKDPPFDPPKLWMVRRIRSFKAKPYWEREALFRLKISDRREIAIVKNTPENNTQLYLIKHLIEIKPITFPYGPPTDAKHAFLKENGECISYNLLAEDKLELEEAQKNLVDLKSKSVDRQTLKDRLRLQWYSRY